MPDAPPEPLSLDDVKLNLRVDGDDEDGLIAALIVAAREHVEDYTGLVLTPREVTEKVSALGPMISLNAWPIASADDIALAYYDRDGTKQQIGDDQWFAIIEDRPVQIRPYHLGWGITAGSPLASLLCQRPTRDLPFTAIVTIQAGFETPDAVPAVIKQAMHLLIAHFYSNRAAAEVGQRAAAIELPFGVAALLRRWRRRVL